MLETKGALALESGEAALQMKELHLRSRTLLLLNHVGSPIGSQKNY
jgi:hypothetical protein